MAKSTGTAGRALGQAREPTVAEWDAKLDTVRREWGMRQLGGVNFSFNGRNYNVMMQRNGRDRWAHAHVEVPGQERARLLFEIMVPSGYGDRAKDQVIAWLKDNGWVR